MVRLNRVNATLEGLRAEAKALNGITDKELANRCDTTLSTLRNHASQKELYTLPYVTVMMMAETAGKKIVFIDKEEMK